MPPADAPKPATRNPFPFVGVFAAGALRRLDAATAFWLFFVAMMCIYITAYRILGDLCAIKMIEVV